MLNPGELQMVKYFILEKGNIGRWADWEARKEIIRERYPYVVTAIERYHEAEAYMLALVKALPEED